VNGEEDVLRLDVELNTLEGRLGVEGEELVGGSLLGELDENRTL
jgi:hypothetical protein